MRCPYCQQNIRVQGRFCPKCGEQIFGLPVHPQGAPPASTPPGAPLPPAPPADPGRGTSPRPTAPAPPPYQPYPDQQPSRGDYDDMGIEVEAEPAPAASAGGPSFSGPPGSAHNATREEVGKTCPYCRFPLKPDEQVVTCPACKLPHHADCWSENRGCTTYGCRGAAGAAPAVPGGPIAPIPSVLSPTGGTVPGLDYLRTNELAARAMNALYLALAGLFCCMPLGVVGLFMGIAVLRDAGPLGFRGNDARTRATWAIVVGILAIVVWVLGFIISTASSSSN